mmetsp:Transcript_12472/g.48585  ORF Transcript_12472/g.48585 Transcript_12472/m.48585 type:complete len:212 (+) Transcript_12472:118-753(+)
MAFHLAPSSLVTSVRLRPGFSATTADLRSLVKMMYAERGFFGALGSFLALGARAFLAAGFFLAASGLASSHACFAAFAASSNAPFTAGSSDFHCAPSCLACWVTGMPLSAGRASAQYIMYAERGFLTGSSAASAEASAAAGAEAVGAEGAAGATAGTGAGAGAGGWDPPVSNGLSFAPCPALAVTLGSWNGLGSARSSKGLSAMVASVSSG